MNEYIFDFIPFIKRVLKSSRQFLIAILIGFWAGVTVTSYFTISLIVSLIFCLIVLFSLAKWNIFFITKVTFFDDKRIHLRIYKYAKLYIDSEFNLDDLEVKLEKASASIRGVSYKIVITINGKKIYQYEVGGWKNKDFEEIVNRINKIKFADTVQ